MTEAEQIAAKLTAGARRACLRMSAEWQFPGKATFNANGAHSLFWAKTGKGKGAVAESQLVRPDPSKRVFRWAYRLTSLGLEVRALLEKSDER